MIHFFSKCYISLFSRQKIRFLKSLEEKIKREGVGKRDEGKSMKSKKKGGNRRDGKGEEKRSEKEGEAKI